MCGIAGIWQFEKAVELNDIKTFTDSMKYRGPDGGGYELFESENLGLGHRRLSILDLSEDAKQPMFYNGKEFCITYNGEVYNFIEIKNELIKKGYVFRTESDTEVILASYKEWGKDCLSKFNGMFAFAIYHLASKELFIARDRYGVKPLHFCFIPGKIFAFASETIAFKYLENYSRVINAPNFTYSINSPGLLESTGETIFNDICQLKAGHYALIKHGKLSITKWYELANRIQHINDNYSKQVEHFKELFFDACKLRLRSDVSVASALSGGIDSSSVFCTIQQLAKQNFSGGRLPKNWQKAFSISFPGTELDEAKFVKLIQQRLNADVSIIENSDVNLINDIVTSTKLFDNITSTPIVSLTDVYKAMHHNKITVSLDGHAGDELLFGYRSAVYEVLFAAHLENKINTKEIAELYILMTKETKNQEEVEAFDLRVSKISENFKPSIKNKIINILKGSSSSDKEKFSVPSNIKGHANQFLYKQFQYLDLPYNLRDFDRAAMQNSIEIRMPMMDFRLVEYVWSLPLESKIGHGYTKRILRDAMKGIVPDEILHRKTKIGLAAPTASWFNGKLAQFLLDNINSQAFVNSSYWDGKRLLKEYEVLTKNKAWQPQEAARAWCVLNAHLIAQN